jgi:hypothetical protein
MKMAEFERACQFANKRTGTKMSSLLPRLCGKEGPGMRGPREIVADASGSCFYWESK